MKKYDLLNEEIIETMPIKIEAGYKVLKIDQNTTMYQFKSGVVGFNYYDKTIYNKFYIVGYEWNGAKYSVQTTQRNRGGGFGGQLIGATAIISGSGTSNAVQREVEEKTLAFFDLQSVETGEIQKISFYCDTKIDAKIKCMKLFEVMSEELVKEEFEKKLLKIEEDKQRDLEEQRKKEEQKRIEKEQKKSDKQRDLEEQRKKEEQKRIEKEQKKSDKQRDLEEQRKKITKEKKPINPYAIAGMIIGIIAILTSCILIGIIPAIASLVLSIIAIKVSEVNKGMAVAGISLSSVSILIVVFVIILAIIGNNMDTQTDGTTKDIGNFYTVCEIRNI